MVEAHSVQFSHLSLLLLVHLHLLVVLFLLLPRDLFIGSPLTFCHVLPFFPGDLANLWERIHNVTSEQIGTHRHNRNYN